MTEGGEGRRRRDSRSRHGRRQLVHGIKDSEDIIVTEDRVDMGTVMRV
jgi:hypothetical protein